MHAENDLTFDRNSFDCDLRQEAIRTGIDRRLVLSIEDATGVVHLRLTEEQLRTVLRKTLTQARELRLGERGKAAAR